jgi:hypothetical protein
VSAGVLKPRRYERSAVETVGDDAVAIFLSTRPRLLAIAGRILASTTEAEDVSRRPGLKAARRSSRRSC